MTTSQTTQQGTETLEQRLAPLATQLADVQAAIADLTEREKGLKAAIRDLVPGSDSYAAAGLTVVVSTNNRFDAAKALPLIPDALRPLVVETVETVNKDRLKALAPAIFEQAQNVGDYRISLR